MAGEAFHAVSMRDEAAKADAAAAKGEKLTEEQTEAQKNLKEQMKEFKPGPEELKKTTAAYAGSFVDVFKERPRHMTPRPRLRSLVSESSLKKKPHPALLQIGR